MAPCSKMKNFKSITEHLVLVSAEAVSTHRERHDVIVSN